MATLLEAKLEKHDGPEPRVLTEDVRAILRRVVRPGSDDGEAVTPIAEKAHVSTRTVYRVLAEPEDLGETATISLDLAGRLCLAAEAHLSACRLAWPDGTVSDY